jgi:hypothetical protein
MRGVVPVSEEEPDQDAKDEEEPPGLEIVPIPHEEDIGHR